MQSKLKLQNMSDDITLILKSARGMQTGMISAATGATAAATQEPKPER